MVKSFFEGLQEVAALKSEAQAASYLKLANNAYCISQYTGAISDRREAWLSAADMPKGLGNEVADSDLVQPSEVDEDKASSVFTRSSRFGHCE